MRLIGVRSGASLRWASNPGAALSGTTTSGILTRLPVPLVRLTRRLIPGLTKDSSMVGQRANRVADPTTT